MSAIRLYQLAMASLLFVGVTSKAATRVDPAVLRLLQSNGDLSVVVNLEGQLDLNTLPKTFASHESQVNTVVGALRAYNQRASAQVMKYLASQGKFEVREITPLWITNSIKVRGSSAVVEDLIAMNGIESIDLDAPKKIFELSPANATLHNNPAHTTVGWGVEKMGSTKLWDRGVKGEGILVAMIDSGANIAHPDLMPSIWTNPGETGTDAQGKDKATNKVDDDGDGFVDNVHGWNFEEKNNDVSDEYGHGSQTAGIVAGAGTGGTQTGVAPKAKMMILKTCCNATDEVFESNVWAAMQFAAVKGARVISMSLTIKPYSNPAYAKWRQADEALLAAGVVHVNSAGNLGSGSEPHNMGAPATNPTAWKHPEQVAGGSTAVITIGATDEKDELRDYSSVGPVTWEDITEYKDYVYKNGQKPGLIKPDVCGPSEVPSTSNDGKTYTEGFSGTSSATPHVAGVVALLLSAQPTLKVAQVVEALQMSAQKVETSFNNKCGAGRVDAPAAVAYAKAHF